MLLLPEEQMGYAWEPSKKQCSFGNRGALDRKVLSMPSNKNLMQATEIFLY
jgi:hypothetical protein